SKSVFVPDDRYKGEVEDRSAGHPTAAAEDVDALDWRPVRIEDFLTWCEEREVPVDFVSTHLYPTDFAFAADGPGVHLSWYAVATFATLVLLWKGIAASAYPDAEISITEWSTTPCSRDNMHNTLFAATDITRSCLQCSALAHSISYFVFTDVFEE